jgi:hypothetical protein
MLGGATFARGDGEPKNLSILRSWGGDYPVSQLDRLPESQRSTPVGYLGTSAVFADVWQAFKPGEKVPEVDFVLSEKGKAFCLIECKTGEETFAPNLFHFQKKLSVPMAIQLLHKTGVCKRLHTEGLTQWVISADQWLPILP